jgi:hypothetical protein
MFQWMGPRRYRPPACTVDQLPGKKAFFVNFVVNPVKLESCISNNLISIWTF